MVETTSGGLPEILAVFEPTGRYRSIATSTDGAVRMDVKQILLVGAPGACAEKINRAFDNGLNTLIIGPALPDLKQLDLFASQVMPRLKLD